MRKFTAPEALLLLLAFLALNGCGAGKESPEVTYPPAHVRQAAADAGGQEEEGEKNPGEDKEKEDAGEGKGRTRRMRRKKRKRRPLPSWTSIRSPMRRSMTRTSPVWTMTGISL